MLFRGNGGNPPFSREGPEFTVKYGCRIAGFNGKRCLERAWAHQAFQGQDSAEGNQGNHHVPLEKTAFGRCGMAREQVEERCDVRRRKFTEFSTTSPEKINGERNGGAGDGPVCRDFERMSDEVPTPNPSLDSGRGESWARSAAGRCSELKGCRSIEKNIT